MQDETTEGRIRHELQAAIERLQEAFRRLGRAQQTRIRVTAERAATEREVGEALGEWRAALIDMLSAVLLRVGMLEEDRAALQAHFLALDAQLTALVAHLADDDDAAPS